MHSCGATVRTSCTTNRSNGVKSITADRRVKKCCMQENKQVTSV